MPRYFFVVQAPDYRHDDPFGMPRWDICHDLANDLMALASEIKTAGIDYAAAQDQNS